MNTTLTSEPTLFDLVGGAPAIDAAVTEFYRRILGDPQLVHFFEGLSIARLARHQAGFLSSALRGEPAPGTAAMLRRVHAGLGITDADFDRVCTHLVATLRSLGLGAELIGGIAATIIPLRNEIVERTADSDATCAFPALR